MNLNMQKSHSQQKPKRKIVNKSALFRRMKSKPTMHIGEIDLEQLARKQLNHSKEEDSFARAREMRWSKDFSENMANESKQERNQTVYLPSFKDRNINFHSLSTVAKSIQLNASIESIRLSTPQNGLTQLKENFQSLPEITNQLKSKIKQDFCLPQLSPVRVRRQKHRP